MNPHTQDPHTTGTYPVQPTLNDQETSNYIPLISSYEIVVANEMKQKLFYKTTWKTKFQNYYLP